MNSADLLKSEILQFRKNLKASPIVDYIKSELCPNSKCEYVAAWEENNTCNYCLLMRKLWLNEIWALKTESFSP